MSESEIENGEEEIDESGRNLTQQDLDDKGVEPIPVDTEREEEQ
jgi:hypothetical protein